MKKFFKSLAVVLALALVITSVPATAASAASVSLKSKTVTLYSEPSTGKTEDGKVCKSYNFWKIAKLLNNFDAETMDIKLVSEDTDLVQKSNKKDMIWVADGASFGTTKVKVIVTSLSTEKVLLEKSITVKVKKNATEDTFKCDLVDGSEFEVGETVAVTLSRKNTDTDARKLTCADDSVEIVDANGYGTKYNVTFTKAGKFTLVASAYQSAKYPAPTVEKEIEVVVTSDFTAELTGVKEITVFGSFTKDTKFAVTKGKATVPFTAEVAADGTSAVLALTGKLSKGTYTVTDGTNSIDLVAEDHKPVEIVVAEHNGFVTTGNDNKVYIHYDVIDQYGDSARNNFNITWTIAPKEESQTVNRSEGIIVVELSEKPDYNDAMHITGVYTSGGAVATVNAMVYIGLPRKVDTVKIVGITEVGTGKLIEELPAGFLNNEFAFVYEIYDQNGYKLPYEDFVDDDSDDKLFNFTSMTPLLIGSTFEHVDNVIIDGEAYGARRITRGINTPVAGDIATIKISSKETGTQSDCEIVLAEEQVLDTFTMYAPESIIAANDWEVEIPFEAYDQNGNAITDFRVFCRGNNTLSLGDGLKLDKQPDGTAKLKYEIHGKINASKSADTPVVLISTVPNSGNVSNVTIYIKADAYSTTVTGLLNTPNYLVEGDSVEISPKLDKSCCAGYYPMLEYVDQYDREQWASNFEKNTETNIVAVVKKSVADAFDVTTSAIQTGLKESDRALYMTFTHDAKLTVTAKKALGSAQAQTFTFALYDTKKQEIVGGSEKRVTLTAVDINKVTEFSLGVDGYFKFDDAPKGLSVKGKYAGETVNIPAAYWNDNNTGIGGAAVIGTGAAIVDGTKVDSLYTSAEQFENKQTSSYLPDGQKDYITRDFKVKVSIRNTMDATTAAAIRDVVTADVKVGATDKAPAEIKVKGTELTISAEAGKLTLERIINACHFCTNCNHISVKDQYGDTMTSAPVTVTISQVTEGGSGIYSESIKLGSGLNINRANATIVTKSTKFTQYTETAANTIMLDNVEFGDTFVLILEAGNVKKTIKFTVVDDETAVYRGSDVIWK